MILSTHVRSRPLAARLPTKPPAGCGSHFITSRGTPAEATRASAAPGRRQLSTTNSSLVAGSSASYTCPNACRRAHLTRCGRLHRKTTSWHCSAVSSAPGDRVGSRAADNIDARGRTTSCAQAHVCIRPRPISAPPLVRRLHEANRRRRPQTAICPNWGWRRVRRRTNGVCSTAIPAALRLQQHCDSSGTAIPDALRMQQHFMSSSTVQGALCMLHMQDRQPPEVPHPPRPARNHRALAAAGGGKQQGVTGRPSPRPPLAAPAAAPKGTPRLRRTRAGAALRHVCGPRAVGMGTPHTA